MPIIALIPSNRIFRYTWKIEWKTSNNSIQCICYCCLFCRWGTVLFSSSLVKKVSTVRLQLKIAFDDSFLLPFFRFVKHNRFVIPIRAFHSHSHKTHGVCLFSGIKISFLSFFRLISLILLSFFSLSCSHWILPLFEKSFVRGLNHSILNKLHWGIFWIFLSHANTIIHAFFLELFPDFVFDRSFSVFFSSILIMLFTAPILNVRRTSKYHTQTSSYFSFFYFVYFVGSSSSSFLVFVKYTFVRGCVSACVRTCAHVRCTCMPVAASVCVRELRLCVRANGR